MRAPWLIAAASILLAGCVQPVRGACGAESSACCPEAKCNAGLTCGTDSVCRACGGAGQGCCAGAACLAGAECGADGVCRACGADGQGCCAGAVCSAGAECREGICRACGAEGQGCCAESSCAAALRCDQGRCVAPCGERCAPDERRCSAGGGVDRCGYSDPPCTAWSTLIAACPEEQECKGGECVARCPGACALDAVLCTTEGARVCTANRVTGCNEYRPTADPASNLKCLKGMCLGSFCWENPLPQGNTLLSIAAVDDRGFYFLDTRGNVLRQFDGQWSYDYVSIQQGATMPEALNALVSCGESRYPMVVGDAGRVLVRRNWSWTEENVGEATSLQSASCWVDIPDLYALAAGRGGALYARDPAGTWTRLPTGTTEALRGVAVDAAAGEGWAVGDAGAIVHCTGLRGMASPACQLEAAGLTTAGLAAVFAAGGGEAFAVGAAGTILQRDAQGRWSRTGSGVLGRDLRAVSATRSTSDSIEVSVAGEGGSFARRIGGAWKAERFTTRNLHGLWASGADKLWAVGAGGEVWLSMAAAGKPAEWRLTAGRGLGTHRLAALAGSGTANVYAAGGSNDERFGVLLHRVDDVWIEEAPGLATRPVAGLAVVSSNEVYAVGGEGQILARRSGVWTVEGAGVTSNDLAAVATDGRMVYAVGANGVWLEKPVQTSGSSWRRIDHRRDIAYLRAIVANPAAAAGDVWAFGSNCSMLHKSGAEFALEPQPSLCDGMPLMAAWATPDFGDLFVGAASAVLHRTAGWEVQRLPSSVADVLGGAANGREAWATAAHGQLFRWSGTRWEQQDLGALVVTDLTSAYLSPEGDLFVTVGTGAILRRR